MKRNRKQKEYKCANKLTVITSSGSKYNAAKLIESNSFELNRPRCIIQISSFIPFLCIFVTVRLKINFGIEYSADVIHTTQITSCPSPFLFDSVLIFMIDGCIDEFVNEATHKWKNRIIFGILYKHHNSFIIYKKTSAGLLSV